MKLWKRFGEEVSAFNVDPDPLSIEWTTCREKEGCQIKTGRFTEVCEFQKSCPKKTYQSMITSLLDTCEMTPSTYVPHL